MNDPTARGTSVVLASFLERFEPLETILRIITSQARIRVQFTFRGEPTRRVMMDLAASPLRIVSDDGGSTSGGGDVWVTIDAEEMHEVFLDVQAPGQALGRRHLLLRGSAAHLAKLIPLFDFAPTLYREHLEMERHAMSDQGTSTTRAMSRQGSNARLPHEALKGVAYGVGYAAGVLRYRLM